MCVCECVRGLIFAIVYYMLASLALNVRLLFQDCLECLLVSNHLYMRDRDLSGEQG